MAAHVELPDRRAAIWKVLSMAIGAAAGLAVQRLLTTGWKAVTDEAPPSDAADRRNSWRQTVTWAAAVGLGAGIARAAANRSAAVAWEAATHEPPPGVGTT